VTVKQTQSHSKAPSKSNHSISFQNHKHFYFFNCSIGINFQKSRISAFFNKPMKFHCSIHIIKHSNFINSRSNIICQFSTLPHFASSTIIKIMKHTIGCGAVGAASFIAQWQHRAFSKNYCAQNSSSCPPAIVVATTTFTPCHNAALVAIPKWALSPHCWTPMVRCDSKAMHFLAQLEEPQILLCFASQTIANNCPLLVGKLLAGDSAVATATFL
jgi:hypothetical protein